MRVLPQLVRPARQVELQVLAPSQTELAVDGRAGAGGPGGIVATRRAVGTPRLTDFGVARMSEAPLTATGAIVGTLAYLSPEALRGEALDARADLWSFGVLLFELLAGRRPFRSEPLGAAITAIEMRSWERAD